jgi:SSS family solute:Na+ symporter
MRMDLLDWLIIIGFMAFLFYMAFKASRYNKSVADFLAANRCAGRYLLGVAEGTAVMGAISVVVVCEIFYKSGFAPTFWEGISGPVGLFVLLSGWIIYRFRQTRALTMAQFFEMRYSRKFRIFTGILAWGAGIINLGIFPSVGARFFINFCGLPQHFSLWGFEVSMFPIVMLVLIGTALYFTFVGGQITIIVADFWQGMFSLFVFFAIVTFLWFTFSWTTLSETLALASKPGVSFINPLDIGEAEDFNYFFFLVGGFFTLYTYMSWQGNQGYYCSASTPHEAKMAKIVGGFRGGMITLGLTLIPLAALAIMFHPDYHDIAVSVTHQLNVAYPDNESLRTQMTVPVALSHVLPMGLIGGFTAAMLAFFISTNNTYLHSWGSILVQDVIMPLRKKPLTASQHIRYLRFSIFGVAIFIFFFGLYFPLEDYIYMFLTITGAIYTGGAGSVIIGGLYWKRGTTAAAWAAMIVGSVSSISAIVLQIIWEKIPFLLSIHDEFPYNMQVMAFCCSVASIVTYVVVSLLGKRTVVNMDRILHRGEYANKEEEKELASPANPAKTGRFWRMIGVNNHEFSKVDKGLFLYMFLMTAWRMGSFLILFAIALAGYMNSSRWLMWWRICLLISLAIALIGAVWVTIGGFIDLRRMYQKLSTLPRNELDDGRVSGDHSLADE